MNPANPFDQGTQAPLSLLQTLTQDADLRARLEADPVATFAEYGIEVQAQDSYTLAAYEGGDNDNIHKVFWRGIF